MTYPFQQSAEEQAAKARLNAQGFKDGLDGDFLVDSVEQVFTQGVLELIYQPGFAFSKAEILLMDICQPGHYKPDLSNRRCRSSGGRQDGRRADLFQPGRHPRNPAGQGRVHRRKLNRPQFSRHIPGL